MSAIQFTSLSPNESFPFLDLSSATIWRRFAIKVSEIHFTFSFRMNLFFLYIYCRQQSKQSPRSRVSEIRYCYFLKMRYSFSRSIVEKDQNTVVDQKWLELTSLSADWISLFSRFIVDNDPNSLLDWKWAESTSLSLIEFFLLYRSILGDDRTHGGKVGPQKCRITIKYQEVPKNTKKYRSQLFPLIGILSSIEWVEFLALSLSKWISSFSRSIVGNDRNTLVDRSWVDFTSFSRWSFSFF